MLTLSLAPPPELRAGASARWELTLTNTSAQPVTLTFPTSQLGDLVLEQKGAERYRWSAGLVFLQVVGERTLERGETWTFELEGAVEAAPGSYEAVGTAACRPSPPAARAAVVVLD